MSEPKKRRPRSKKNELPQILKTAHGSAYMNFKGTRHFLGTYGSREAEQKRLQIVTEYEAGLQVTATKEHEITVAMLAARYLAYAKKKFRKHGRSTGSYERLRRCTKPLLSLYASTPVSDIKAKSIRAVRQIMVDSGKLCRETINTRATLIIKMFKWGVGHDLVSPDIAAKLSAIEPLYPGETLAKERPPVDEVEPATVNKTLPHLAPAIASMVRLQILTGMRPGEVVAMRPTDIYRQGDKYPDGYKFFSRLDLHGCWVYIPAEHKTEHHNKARFVILNKACQKILDPYLKRREHDDYVFSPEAEQELRYARMREARKTKIQPSQRSRKKQTPKKTPGKKYSVNSYRSSIQNAIKRYNKKLAKNEDSEGKMIPRWFPNQLRHQFATVTRENESLEAAQVALGHSSMKTTEIYARKSAKEAIEVALRSTVCLEQETER